MLYDQTGFDCSSVYQSLIYLIKLIDHKQTGSFKFFRCIPMSSSVPTSTPLEALTIMTAYLRL